MAKSKRKSGSKPKATEKGSSVSGDEEYEVEQIIDHKQVGGRYEFLVRWKGFQPNDDTWEVESNLGGSEDLIAEYKETIQEDTNNGTNNDADSDENDDGGANKKAAKKRKSKTPKKLSVTFKKAKKAKEDSDMEDDEEDEEKEDKENGTNNDEDSDASANLIKKTPAKKRFSKGGGGAKKTAAKKSKKKKNESDAEDEEDDDDNDGDEEKTEEFEVQKIIDVHYLKKSNKKEYLVRWKGYTSKDDTWEPESHLKCKDLIDAFEAKLGKIKNVSEKALRVDRKKTNRLVLEQEAVQARHSKRNVGHRKNYIEED